jgi:hypothetical protein
MKDPTIQNAAQENAENAADAMAAGIIAHNRRIAAVLTQARKQIELIGAPDALMVRGYDFPDLLDMLRDLTPTFDSASVARVAEQVAA